MVPAEEGATFEVIETELALHILVDALGAPALLDETDEALPTLAPRREIEEMKLGRLGLAVLPFHEQTNVLAYRRVDAIVVVRITRRRTKRAERLSDVLCLARTRPVGDG